MYQSTCLIRSALRWAASVRSAVAAILACPRSVVSHVANRSDVLPALDDHATSVSQTGTVPPLRRMTSRASRTVRSTPETFAVYGWSATASKAPRPPAA